MDVEQLCKFIGTSLMQISRGVWYCIFHSLCVAKLLRKIANHIKWWNPFAALLGGAQGGPPRDQAAHPTTTGADTTTGSPAPNTNPLPNPWAAGGGKLWYIEHFYDFIIIVSVHVYYSKL